jgi:PAS domain S-box-containing protein
MSKAHSLEVLLIEDNPGDARYIEELLREATELSLRVREDDQQTTSHGDSSTPALTHTSRLEEGLELLAKDQFDAVLLDLNLPDSNGIETLSVVLDGTDVPVLVLTGRSDREVGTTALREGAEEYLVKDEINGDLLVRSLFHAIERRQNQREMKRHELLLEESTDVNAIFALDGTFQYVTPSVETVLGYEPTAIVGDVAVEYVHPDDRSSVEAAFERLLDGDEETRFEFRFEHADGDWVILEAHGRNLSDDPLVDGVVVYMRDVTERVERERKLARQREHLAALNDLNGVVREINEALVEQSTREEIEELVVDRLAESDSYSGAWIGDVDLLRTARAVERQLE